MQISCRVKKGEVIYIPILAINQAKSFWGEDAKEFRRVIRSTLFSRSQYFQRRRPERWGSIPEAAHKIPGVWANQLSFLGGPHACIGHRFSIMEFDIILLCCH